MGNILIGIDPDVDKSGVAMKAGEDIELSNLSFFDLLDFVNKVNQKKKKSEKILVVIEGGWLNKSNWHKKEEGSAAVNATIGNRTGANHETGRKIVEMMEYLKVPFLVKRPTKSKVNGAFFKRITGIEKSNQEQRDAFMMIYGL